MPGGGALPPLELCGFFDVFDSRARAHQYCGFLVPFALLAALLVVLLEAEAVRLAVEVRRGMMMMTLLTTSRRWL